MSRLILAVFWLLLLSGCTLEPGALIIRPDPEQSASPAPSLASKTD